MAARPTQIAGANAFSDIASAFWLTCDMTAIARLAGVSLDTADPVGLANFYRQLLGLETYLATDEFVALKGANILITTQRVDNHLPPSWPTGPTPKQVHLELAVGDLETAELAAVALGATRPAEQPSPDQWRVLIDPAGHPFCITTLIPSFDEGG